MHTMKNTKFLTAVTAASVSALLLAACGGSAGGGEIVEGGTLRFGVEVVDCADPHQRGNNPASYQLKPLTDNLLAQDPDTGEYLPWLATEYTVNDDATEFVFTLRDDVSFSDGSELTAEDAAASFNAIVDELGAAASLAIGYLNDYDRATATGDYELTVTFDEPNIAFLQGVSTGNLGLVAEATSSLSAEERCAEGAVGTGPFVIDEYVPNDTLSFTKREDYGWANPLAENQGPAHLDRIEIVHITETAVLADSLISGQIDAYSVVLAQDVQRIEDAGGEVYTTTNGGYPVAILPNLENEVLADPAVRRAVQIGFDRELVIQGVIGDWFEPSTSALSHATVGYTDLSDSLEYQPDEARRILDEAGWEVGEDGIREKDGVRLSFDVSGQFSWNDSPGVLAIIREQLSEIGVDLEINLLPTGQEPEYVDAGRHAARWVNGYTPEPDTLRAVLSIDAGNWLRRDTREDLDDLLERQVQLADPQERNAVLADVQEVLIDEAYLIPIYDWAQSFAIGPKVGGDVQLPFLSGPGPLYTDLALTE